MNSLTLQALWKQCPALHDYLQGYDYPNTNTLDQALRELEAVVQSYERTINDQTTALVNSHVVIKNTEETVEKLLIYVRYLQIIISRIYEGKIDSRLRVAVEKIHEGWLLHRTLLDLGAQRRSAVINHVAAMLDKADYFLGIELSNLKDQVFDAEEVD